MSVIRVLRWGRTQLLLPTAFATTRGLPRRSDSLTHIAGPLVATFATRAALVPEVGRPASRQAARSAFRDATMPHSQSLFATSSISSVLAASARSRKSASAATARAETLAFANPGSTTRSKRDQASSVVWALPQSARDAAHRAEPTRRSPCSRTTSSSAAENSLVFPWIRPDSCLRQRRKHESVNAIRSGERVGRRVCTSCGRSSGTGDSGRT